MYQSQHPTHIAPQFWGLFDNRINSKTWNIYFKLVNLGKKLASSYLAERWGFWNLNHVVVCYLFYPFLDQRKERRSYINHLCPFVCLSFYSFSRKSFISFFLIFSMIVRLWEPKTDRVRFSKKILIVLILGKKGKKWPQNVFFVQFLKNLIIRFSWH